MARWKRLAAVVVIAAGSATALCAAGAAARPATLSAGVNGQRLSLAVPIIVDSTRLHHH